MLITATFKGESPELTDFASRGITKPASSRVTGDLLTVTLDICHETDSSVALASAKGRIDYRMAEEMNVVPEGIWAQPAC